MKQNPFLKLKEKAVNQFYPKGFRVILKDEPEYNTSREISNSYFDKKPGAIAFPRTAKQVKACLDYCIEHNLLFRIRSGGHQHEGMSSLDDGLMIRLSDMSLIEYCNTEKSQAWIDSGMKLGTVYSELVLYDKVIPAGGCSNVNVGGITQGGGWGLHSRLYGLTCDNIIAAEIVLADGSIEEVSADNKPELFWALRGGGGGNFGIVTRFKFKLSNLGSDHSRFRFGWRQESIEKVTKAWLDLQEGYPNELTSFIRFSVTDTNAPRPKKDTEYKPNEFPIYGGGLFFGKRAKLEEIMGPLIEAAPPNAISFEPENTVKGGKSGQYGSEDFSIMDLFGYDDFTSELPGLEQYQASSSCTVTPPSVTCNIPHPHKVSSAFPQGKGHEYNGTLAKAIAIYIAKEDYDHSNVRSYLTLHAMGGTIAKQPDKIGASFAYRDKAFLLQMQSWWDYPNGKEKECREDNNEQQKYIDWVIKFRTDLADAGLVEGAFINFIDKDLPLKGTTAPKHELLKYYYKHNLEELIRIKRLHDPEDKFHFDMSIPL